MTLGMLLFTGNSLLDFMEREEGDVPWGGEGRVRCRRQGHREPAGAARARQPLWHLHRQEEDLVLYHHIYTINRL